MSTLNHLMHDRIGQLDLRPCPTVHPLATVDEANAAMRHNRVGAVIIVDQAGKPIGMFNEKLLIRLLAERPDALGEHVVRHMARHLHTLPLSASIGDLLDTMRMHSLRWVCVVDITGRPVALTGLRGLITHVVENYLPDVVKVHPIESHLAMAFREGA
ncbi:MAG: CBS domain-containing protein [Phycisphaera sp.]|nr:CBS domain-containing protein [Phycisphaera sp.]